MKRKKMTKKTLIIMVSVMLCAIASISILVRQSTKFVNAAAGKIEVKVQAPASAKTGEDIEANVVVDKQAGFGSATIVLTYDSTALKVKSATAGTMLADGMTSINKRENGKITMTFISLDDITASGSLLDVRFEVLEGAKGESSLGLSVKLQDQSGTEVNVNTTDATVTLIDSKAITSSTTAANNSSVPVVENSSAETGDATPIYLFVVMLVLVGIVVLFTAKKRMFIK